MVNIHRGHTRKCNKRRKLTASERQQIYEKFGGRCAYCGCNITIKEMQADHVVPLHLGGADDIINLYPACRSCNHYKSTYTVERFREIIQRAPAVLMKGSATYRNIVRFRLIEQPQKPVVQFFFENTGQQCIIAHGHWTDDDDFEVCSCCHELSDYRYKYCPNCGAKMDGGGTNA